MDQYAGIPITVPTIMQNSLHILSTSSITVRHLLGFMVQGKTTEADALTIRLDATLSGLSVPLPPSYSTQQRTTDAGV